VPILCPMVFRIVQETVCGIFQTRTAKCVARWAVLLPCDFACGISGDNQLKPMKMMSPGYRTRVVMMMISLVNPHVLLLDEPTNHLDMNCIDALAEAINKFTGGLVLVSHDSVSLVRWPRRSGSATTKVLRPGKGIFSRTRRTSRSRS